MLFLPAAVASVHSFLSPSGRPLIIAKINPHTFDTHDNIINVIINLTLCQTQQERPAPNKLTQSVQPKRLTNYAKSRRCRPVCPSSTEVKSIRDGKMNIRDGYVRPTKDGRSCIVHVHIGATP
jgi:hypothetical protein